MTCTLGIETTAAIAFGKISKTVQYLLVDWRQIRSNLRQSPPETKSQSFSLDVKHQINNFWFSLEKSFHAYDGPTNPITSIKELH